MLDIETGLHLKEFLSEVHRQDCTSFAPPARLSLLIASTYEPCPLPELRVQAIRHLEECLIAVEHFSESGDLVELCVATMWNTARPCLGPTFRQLVFRNLQKVRRAVRVKASEEHVAPP